MQMLEILYERELLFDLYYVMCLLILICDFVFVLNFTTHCKTIRRA